MRKCEGNSPADTEVSEEQGGGGAPGARVEVSLGPGVPHRSRLQARTAAHGEQVFFAGNHNVALRH